MRGWHREASSFLGRQRRRRQPAGMAEAGGATVDAVLVPACAMGLSRQLDRLGVEHHLRHLDENEVRDRQADQRGEELPWQRGEAEAGCQRRNVRATPTATTANVASVSSRRAGS